MEINQHQIETCDDTQATQIAIQISTEIRKLATARNPATLRAAADLAQEAANAFWGRHYRNGGGEFDAGLDAATAETFQRDADELRAFERRIPSAKA